MKSRVATSSMATLDNSGRSWQSDPLDAIIANRLQQASAFQNPAAGLADRPQIGATTPLGGTR